MSDLQKVDTRAARQPNGFAKVVLALFTKQATVIEHQQLSERFHLLTLESPAFKGLRWTAGQKLQIMLGSAFVARTFTPLQWDTDAGQTRVLVYAHGSSPAGDWIRELQAGERVNVFGPRASLDLEDIAGPVVLVGDETSIGLACALLNQHPTRPLVCLLEVNALETTRAVLTRLAIDNAQLFERRPEDAHLVEIEEALKAHAGTGATLVMTGKAPSIQRLRRTLKQMDVSAARMPTKAYWSPGKVGLD